MARVPRRYRVGRAAAAILTAAGRLERKDSLPLAGSTPLSLSPGGVTIVWRVAAPCGVRLGQIGRAALDITARRGARDGG